MSQDLQETRYAEGTKKPDNSLAAELCVTAALTGIACIAAHLTKSQVWFVLPAVAGTFTVVHQALKK